MIPRGYGSYHCATPRHAHGLAGPRIVRRRKTAGRTAASAVEEVLTLAVCFRPGQPRKVNGPLVAIVPIPSIAVGIGPIPAQIGSGPARDGPDDGHGNQCTQGHTRNDPAVVWPAYPWPRMPIGPSPPPVAWASTPVLSGDHRRFELGRACIAKHGRLALDWFRHDRRQCKCQTDEALAHRFSLQHLVPAGPHNDEELWHS